VVRLAANGPPSASAGPTGRPEADPAADAEDGGRRSINDRRRPSRIPSTRSGRICCAVSTFAGRTTSGAPMSPASPCEGLPLPRRRDGLGEPPRAGVAVVEHEGCRSLLHAFEEAVARHGRPKIFNTDLGQPVHQPSVHRGPGRRRRSNFHERTGQVDGQRLHRAAMAVDELRVHLVSHLRDRLGSPRRHWTVDRVPQLRPTSLDARGGRTPVEVHEEAGGIRPAP
jgi:hypothetical protein